MKSAPRWIQNDNSAANLCWSMQTAAAVTLGLKWLLLPLYSKGSSMCPCISLSHRFWLFSVLLKIKGRKGKRKVQGRESWCFYLTILQKTSRREGIMAQSFLSVTGFPLHISSHTVFPCVHVHVCMFYHIYVHLYHYLCALGSKAISFP